MRICRFELDGVARVGAVEGASVAPFPDAVTAAAVLEMDPDQRAALRQEDALPLASVRLLIPVQPQSVRDFVGFEQHVAALVRSEGLPGVPDAWYEAPAFYFSSPAALFATEEEIEVPPGCQRFDFELEVAAIVGSRVRHLSVGNAADAIAGYAILNDWSARDLQAFDRRAGMGWAKGKDTATTLGPWIVTADELADKRRPDGRLELTMSVWLNGELVGEDSLANVGWSFEQMLVYASCGAWLVPGDVVGSGTCGYGCLAEHWSRSGKLEPAPLKPGDEVTMTVERIGTIRNRVVAGAQPVDYGSPKRATERLQ